MDPAYYLKNGRYTAKCPTSFLTPFRRRFLSRPQTLETIHKIIVGLLDHFSYRGYVTTTHNLRLSRFIPVDQIIRLRLGTCGAIAAVSASVLRNLGYPTKLIHGKHRARGRWLSHAWIEVYVPNRKTFIPIDPAKNVYRLSRWYRRHSEYRDWHDLELELKRGARSRK